LENYVVLSDLHLGEEMNECTFADAVNIDRFAKELEQVGEVKQLVLLGDVLDLALSPISRVTSQLKNFLDPVHTIPEKIIYVPGNHDHHIWALHAEQKMVEMMRRGDICSSPDYINLEFIGADSFVSGYLPASSMDKLVVKYPIHEIRLSNGKRCLFHHGHQIYGVGVRLLSLKEALKEIPEVERMRELELQNIGVYELLWFYLELSERMRGQIEENWEEYGGFGAFSIVAKEMADKRIVSAGHEIYKFFSGKPKERGRTIAGNKNELKQYLEVLNKPIECLIYGHSHVPELIAGLDDDLPEIIGNCGSWLKGKRRHNTYIVINADSVVLKELGADIRDEDCMEWK
jgi:UDP-2,3-diacylglucosamine pyrophosphatase LpxH